MAFNFDFLFRPWGAEPFRRSAERWYGLLPDGAWPNFVITSYSIHYTKLYERPYESAIALNSLKTPCTSGRLRS